MIFLKKPVERIFVQTYIRCDIFTNRIQFWLEPCSLHHKLMYFVSTLIRYQSNGNCLAYRIARVLCWDLVCPSGGKGAPQGARARATCAGTVRDDRASTSSSDMSRGRRGCHPGTPSLRLHLPRRRPPSRDWSSRPRTRCSCLQNKAVMRLIVREDRLQTINELKNFLLLYFDLFIEVSENWPSKYKKLL